MKSKIRNILYVNAKGETKNRKVFVMSEDDTYIRGYDISLIDKDTAKELKKLYKGHEVKQEVTFKGAAPSNRPKTKFDTCIRTFKKENILETHEIKDFFSNLGL